jgi:MFS family permease
MDDARVTKAGFGAVLAVAEFRAMWIAELLSVCGDQLARVALAVLVYQRTSSAALTGLTYALTYVPSLLGGVLLAGAGDRWPRRDVMVAADLARTALVAVIAIPGVPLWVLCVLVAVMTALGGPFKAAQQALLPTVLAGEQYLVGMALRNVTIQGAQLAGFAGGGALIAALTPSAALALDAATFLLSALFLVTGVRRRAAIAQAVRPAWLSTTGAGIRLIWRDPALRTLVALNWLAGFYIVPEALAAPYAAGIGAGATLVGLLMAADPAGSVLGGFVFGKAVPEHVQVRVLGLLGIAAGLPLVLFVFRPGLVVSVVLLATSGLLATGYNIQGTVSFMRRVPDEHRAQCAGGNSAGLITVQGVGAAAAGALAEVVSPAHTIAVAGAAGAAVAVPIARAWRRVRLEER